MDTPEVAVARYAAKISLWALGMSCGSLVVAFGVFVLELRRWFDEGVRLTLNIMIDGKMFGGPIEDENTYLVATVTNRGSAATTVTHMTLLNYPTRLARLLPRRLLRLVKARSPQTLVVTHTGAPGPIPFVLEPGRNWVGMARHNDRLEKMISGGRLYVGIITSDSDKALYRKVRRSKLPRDAKSLNDPD